MPPFGRGKGRRALAFGRAAALWFLALSKIISDAASKNKRPGPKFQEKCRRVARLPQDSSFLERCAERRKTPLPLRRPRSPALQFPNTPANAALRNGRACRRPVFTKRPQTPLIQTAQDNESRKLQKRQENKKSSKTYVSELFKWRVWESNPRPQHCERCALPTELTPQFFKPPKRPSTGFKRLLNLASRRNLDLACVSLSPTDKRDFNRFREIVNRLFPKNFIFFLFAVFRLKTRLFPPFISPIFAIFRHSLSCLRPPTAISIFAPPSSPLRPFLPPNNNAKSNRLSTPRPNARKTFRPNFGDKNRRPTEKNEVWARVDRYFTGSAAVDASPLATQERPPFLSRKSG